MPESQDNVAVVEEGDFAGNRPGHAGQEWESMRDATCLVFLAARISNRGAPWLMSWLGLDIFFLEAQKANVT